MICHGQGDQRADPHTSGCCELPGAGNGICPMRWRVDPTGNVYNSSNTLVDTLDQAIRNTFGVNNPNIREDIVEFLGWQPGFTMMLCTAAAQAAVDHWAEFMASQGQAIVMTNRAQFDVRWSEEFNAGGSAEAVGDVWVTIARPRNWCVTFGPDLGQCCHRENQATNDTRRGLLSTAAVSVRSQASGAS